MSERYLLPCACGKNIAVETSQAGRRVTCDCGARLDVPTLREIRKLPKAETEMVPARPTWANRHRFFFLGGLLLLSGIVVGVVTEWNRPLPPLEEIRRREEAKADEYRRAADEFSGTTIGQQLERFARTDLAAESRYRRSQDPVFLTYGTRMKQHQGWVWLAWGLGLAGIVTIAVTHILAGTVPRIRNSGPRRRGA